MALLTVESGKLLDNFQNLALSELCLSLHITVLVSVFVHRFSLSTNQERVCFPRLYKLVTIYMRLGATALVLIELRY